MKIFLVSLIHSLYLFTFLALFFASFWIKGMELPFVFMAAITLISWVPYKDCPLLVWENKLRGKINLQAKQFFIFTSAIRNFFSKSFGIKIPAFTTVYVVSALIFVKIIF